MDLLDGRDLRDTAGFLADNTSLAAGLAHLMDEMAYGILVMSRRAEVLHANQAARQELETRRLLEMRTRKLHAIAPDHGRTLDKALAKACEGKRSLITLTTSAGATLSLAVLPLGLNDETGGSKVGVLLARSSICESLMLCFFARNHGLTHTEEQVLGILCQGYSAPEIASQLKVAVSTIRSHVRSLCLKTRSSGVRELVNQIAVLPPVASALGREPLH